MARLRDDAVAVVGRTQSANNVLPSPPVIAILPNMGTISKTCGPMNALFSSVQRRLLTLMFTQSDRSFYTSQIIRAVSSGTGAVTRELLRLRQSGIISAERVGNRIHYRANRLSPIFAELRGIVLKTLSPEDVLRETLSSYQDRVAIAFIYGSVAKGSDTARSDIDVMVIGENLDYVALYDAFQHAEDRLKRTVSATFVSPKEWSRKSSRKGSFADRISAGRKIFLVGSERDLRT